MTKSTRNTLIVLGLAGLGAYMLYGKKKTPSQQLADQLKLQATQAIKDANIAQSLQNALPSDTAHMEADFLEYLLS